MLSTFKYFEVDESYFFEYLKKENCFYIYRPIKIEFADLSVVDDVCFYGSFSLRFLGEKRWEVLKKLLLNRNKKYALLLRRSNHRITRWICNCILDNVHFKVEETYQEKEADALRIEDLKYIQENHL